MKRQEEKYPVIEIESVKIIGRIKKTKEKIELVMDKKTFEDWRKKLK